MREIGTALTFCDLFDFALVAKALGETPSARRISVFLHCERARSYLLSADLLQDLLKSGCRDKLQAKGLFTFASGENNLAEVLNVIQIVAISLRVGQRRIGSAGKKLQKLAADVRSGKNAAASMISR